MMKLSIAKIGVKYRVLEVDLEGAVARRLEVLGLIKGTTIELLEQKRNGAVIFRIRGTRLAVGKNIADGISIERSNPNETKGSR